MLPRLGAAEAAREAPKIRTKTGHSLAFAAEGINATRRRGQGNPRFDYVGVLATVPDYQTEAAPRRTVDMR